MSDKSVWQGFGDLLGRKGGGKALTTVEQRCPECHNALDPRWSKCPYCEAAKNASRQSTRLGPDPAAQPAPQATQATRGPTLVDMGGMDTVGASASARPVNAGAATMAPEPGSPGGGRRHTVVEPVSDGSLGVERHVGGGRRITGIVTTFTWSRLGQLYVVRDGRNYAGSGVVSADNNAPCEILVPEDRTMSSAHFLILCQSGKYIISDNFSTNGTFLNGDQIDTRGMELPDDAVIKAGATVFKFQKIVAAAGPTQEPAREQHQGWRPGDNEETVA